MGREEHLRHDTVPQMIAWREQPARKRAETWLWTGPVGHLLGGAADLAGALCKHGLAGARTRVVAAVRGHAGARRRAAGAAAGARPRAGRRARGPGR